jgi:polysaccharide biosynthesis protein VpsM
MICVGFNYCPTKQMKKTTLILTILAALGASGYAAPFLAVGDNAEVFITGQVGVRSDSNIYLAGDDFRAHDLIFDFNPGVELDFGKGSQTTGLVSFTEKFASFDDHDELNTNLASALFNANYDDGKNKLGTKISYDELNQNSIDALSDGPYLIRSNVFAAGATGEISVTEKTSIAVGANYRWADYRRTGFADAEVVALPVHVYYEVTPKVDVGVGYQYRASWLQFGEDSFDHFFSISGRGEFTPKLTGTVDVGLTQRHFSHATDTSLLGVDANLTYAVSPKTNVNFGASSGFDANSQAQQQKNLAFNAQVSTALSDVWTGAIGASYRTINYYQISTPRTDDYLEGQVSLSYTINVYAKVTAGITYRQNQSDLRSSDFYGSVFSLAANLRF